MACLMFLSGPINGINFTYRAVQLKQRQTMAPLQHIRCSGHLHKAAIKLLLWLHAAVPQGTAKQAELDCSWPAALEGGISLDTLRGQSKCSLYLHPSVFKG